MNQDTSNKPCIIILAAPSGSGKSTLSARLIEAIPSIFFSVSATTRAPRAHEKSGEHYYFLSNEAFIAQKDAGLLLEYEEVYPGCWYGTLKSEIERSSKEAPVLLDIDVVGALNVKQQYADRCLAVFIKAPSLEALSARLKARGTETEESLALRIGKASHELTFERKFDHVVVNDDLEKASLEVISLVRNFLRSC